LSLMYTKFASRFVLHFTQYLKVAFTISTPVNGGMGDCFICAQILKEDIADIIESYTNSIVFLNFEMSTPLMLP
jgi:hypothetical protein